jgi:antitoxin CptB
MSEFDRISWRCRRGLLELDLVLTHFLDHRFDGLDAGQRQLFSELLDQPDNDLLDLAMGRREAAPRYQALVEMLRSS